MCSVILYTWILATVAWYTVMLPVNELHCTGEWTHRGGTSDPEGASDMLHQAMTGGVADATRHGFGSCVWRAGVGTVFSPALLIEWMTSYEGEWRYGRMSGRGTYRSMSGALWEGEWAMDVQHGDGMMALPDGSTITGKWEKGELVCDDAVLVGRMCISTWPKEEVCSKVTYSGAVKHGYFHGGNGRIRVDGLGTIHSLSFTEGVLKGSHGEVELEIPHAPVILHELKQSETVMGVAIDKATVHYCGVDWRWDGSALERKNATESLSSTPECNATQRVMEHVALILRYVDHTASYWLMRHTQVTAKPYEFGNYEAEQEQLKRAYELKQEIEEGASEVGDDATATPPGSTHRPERNKRSRAAEL